MAGEKPTLPMAAIDWRGTLHCGALAIVMSRSSTAPLGDVSV